MTGALGRHPVGLRLTGLGMGLVLVLAPTGCATAPDADSVAGQARAGDRKGYVSGDGSVEQIKEADRDTPLTLAGPTVDGRTWSLNEHRGQVVVLNVWGSWCPPCITETPELDQAYRDLTGRFEDVTSGKAPATPTALVLDRQHRIAARVLGPLTAATLVGLVEDVRAT